jgi:O-antigen ligase
MSFLILIAAVAALLWGTLFVLRGWLPAGCVAFLVAASCFGHAFLQFDLGPLPLTIDRLVLPLLLAAYLVQRRLGRAEPKPLAGADYCVLLFAGILGVSTFTHEWRVTSPGDISPLWRLSFGYLMPLGLYWISRQSALSERGVWWVQASLAAFGLYLALTGLAEISGQWWLVFPSYISDPTVGIHFGRARGPMVQAACYGTVLAICLLSAWTWRARLGRVGQLILLASLPLFGAAIYFSYTRSAWAESLLGLTVILGLTLRGRLRWAVLGGIAVCCLAVATAKWDSIIGFKREQSADETRKSAHMRGSFAYASWLMFRDRPLWGCGFGHYQREVLPYLADRSSNHDLESIRGYVHHNTLLCLLVETGLLGALAFLGILAGWARAAWQLYRNPLSPTWVRTQAVLLLAALAAYLVQLLSHEVSYTGLETMFVFFLAGITMALRPWPQTAMETSAAVLPLFPWRRAALTGSYHITPSPPG